MGNNVKSPLMSSSMQSQYSNEDRESQARRTGGIDGASLNMTLTSGINSSER